MTCCMELKDVGFYYTDGKDIWLEMPVINRPTTIFAYMKPLETPLREKAGQVTLFSDGVMYKFTEYTQSMKYEGGCIYHRAKFDYILTQECNALTQRHKKVSMDRFQDAAPTIAASMQRNRDSYASEYDAVFEEVSQYLIPDLANMIAFLVANYIVLKVGF